MLQCLALATIWNAMFSLKKSITTLAVVSSLCCFARASSTEADKISPDVALEKLVRGNRDFVAGTPRHPDQEVTRRAALAKGQHPFAIVLTCADSRVSPEIYFDQGLGDLFVLRNAGNILDEHIIGSIEYAVEHLGSRLLIVVGHSQCGAVAAAVAGGHAPGHIQSIVDAIEPAVLAVAHEAGDKIDNVVRTNARFVAFRLAKTGPILAKAVSSGELRVVAARYDLETGKIELLDMPAIATPAGVTTSAKAPAAHATSGEVKPAATGH
jgi:carbonic anhydrase